MQVLQTNRSVCTGIKGTQIFKWSYHIQGLADKIKYPVIYGWNL